MKQTNKSTRIIGWILFVFAIGFFCLQMGYFYVHANYQAEYVDNRIFYLVNILFVICIALAMWLLLHTKKRWKQIGVGVVAVIFMIANVVLMVNSNKQVKNRTSISPDLKHVFSVKEDIESGEAVYYRSYFNILARPTEKLPYKIDEVFSMEWLANDVAALTYGAPDNTIHLFVGTYGSRDNSQSYHYVGAEMQGEWADGNTRVVSNTDGISVSKNGETESFDWDHIVQFGTLTVVLMNDNEAAWTISLNKNFESNTNASIPPSGDITLYKAAMEKNKPVTLHYVGRSE